MRRSMRVFSRTMPAICCHCPAGGPPRRFGLRALRITVGGRVLSIRLFGGWDPQHPGATTLAAIAGRLSEFIIDHYGDSARPS